jgi:imidazolonepropionase-like amidohydrolase
MHAPKPGKLAVLLTVLAAGHLQGETKVFKNFTLIDGTGRPPVAQAAMIVDNGRIRWVGAAAALQVPAAAEVMDLSGRFVVPGIVNLHGHIGTTIDLTQHAKFFTRENIEKNLRTYAEYGVTTVLSLGTDQDLIFRMRQEQRAGRPAMARVYTAGQGFVFRGGYGGLAGVNRGIGSIAEVEPGVAEQAGKGVDIIKLWMDDELGRFPKMPYPMAKAIIDAAHRRGLRVVAHIFYLEDARQLTSYGVDGLAHSVRDHAIDPDLVAAMKKHGTWQMASTLSREASMFIYGKTPFFAGDPFFMRSVSAAVLATLRSPEYQQSISSGPHFAEYQRFFENARRNLKTEADAGVPYGFGTDTGPPGRFPGYFEHWEMQLMVEAGLTPMQVLTAATGKAAQFLRAQDLGTLEPAKWADFVVLQQNPLGDIRNMRSIDAVYIAGNSIKR